jgi:replicative DNA helicase
MSSTLEQKREEFRKMLKNIKNTAESYVVLSIYKNTELYFDSNLTTDDFHDPIWKFYFAIAKKLIEDDKKVLDDIVVGLVVSENEQLQKIYDEYGGYQTIANGISFVQEENFDGYLLDIKKYNALLKLHDLGFPIMEKFDNYKIMSIDKIQQILEGVLATVFADVDIEEKVEDLSDGLWQVVEDAHAGKMRGFPLTSSLLNEYMNGLALGNITMLSANSGIGKTFLTISQILPNMIEFNEKLLILANEEDSVKWKRELITWAVNNMTGGDFPKHRFNQGEFSKDELDMLKKGVNWLNEQMNKGIIQFVNFNSFNMKKAIKLIKKYAKIHGVKYFILDTLKLDADALNENAQAWLQLQQNMVKLYDLVKPSNLNLSVWVTYQLGKSAMLQRYLSQNSLGTSKNVVDVVSTLMLVRKALHSELEGGKNEVEVKTKDGKKVKMNKEKEYFIIFLGKNRMGATHRQIVLEVDMSKNIVTDFGTCLIEQDY